MSFTKTINPTEVITLKDKTAKLKPADLKMKGEDLVKNTIGASTIAAKKFIPNAMAEQRNCYSVTQIRVLAVELFGQYALVVA